MMEDVDYSEEAKFDLFESVAGSSADWARCIVAGTRPSYEAAKRKASKMGRRLTVKQYEKACRELGLKG